MITSVELATYITQAISSSFSPTVSGLLLGLTFGYSDQMNSSMKLTFRQLGLFHLFAASGFHLTYVSQIISRIASMFPIKIIRLSFIIMGILSYIAATRFSISVLRASSMFFYVFFCRYCLQRKASPANSLLFTVVTMVGIHPPVFMKVGFQLSVLAVTGIMVCRFICKEWFSHQSLLVPFHTVNTHEYSNRAGFLLGFVQYLRTLLLVSCSALFFTLPLLAFYFQEVSLAGFFASSVVLWAVPLLMSGTLLFIGLYFLGITSGVASITPILGTLAHVVVQLSLFIEGWLSILFFTLQLKGWHLAFILIVQVAIVTTAVLYKKKRVAYNRLVV